MRNSVARPLILLLTLYLVTVDCTHDTGTSGGINFNYLTGMPEALSKPPVPGSSIPNYQNQGATPEYPMYFDASASVDYIKQIEKGALIRAKELIDTDTYTSLNDYQWDLAQNAIKGQSNYGHLAGTTETVVVRGWVVFFLLCNCSQLMIFLFFFHLHFFSQRCILAFVFVAATF